MPTTQTCPTCGAAILPGTPDGHCAACLLALMDMGLNEPTRSDSSGGAEVGRPSALEMRGERIGRYTLLDKLGEGGMGTVWKAEQTDPVRRFVALKVIKPGMDSSQVLARFEAERQALAMMDHPHIAKFFDAGAVGGSDISNFKSEISTGRPYFVMELVSGFPITQFADAWRLTLRERLELFVQVCHAIQHAHQKGVIHRDIKPSNILVLHQDDGPVPKVIDFGIAKAIGQPLTERTLATGLGAVVGTLEYMSPEQAGLGQADIDTRSDIYNLGVLLYELLTGSTPLTRETIRDTVLDEVLRRIREEDAPKPSTRLAKRQESNHTNALLPLGTRERGGLGRSRTADDGSRQPTPPGPRSPPGPHGASGELQRLLRALRGDVDWIVMKALEKDRNRRYESAAALAQDVQRYLRDEPVLAGPPSRIYRVRKFVRKHRLAVTSATVLILGLLAATVVSVVMASRAMRAERQALASAAGARQEEQRRRAVARFYAENLIRPVSPKPGPGPFKRGEPARPAAIGRDVKLRDVLEAAEKKLGEEFPDQPILEAGIRSELGLAFQELGEYTNAIRQHERALQVHRLHEPTNTAALRAALNNLGTAYGQAGQSSNELALLNEALALAQSPGNAGSLEALVELNNLALALKHVGRLDEAVGKLEQILRLRRQRLGPDHPDSLLSLHNLALTLHAAERLEESLPLYEENYARSRTNALLGPLHPDTLLAAHDVGGIHSEMGNPAHAVPYFEQALAGMRVILTERHLDTLSCLNDLGVAHYRLRRYEPAVRHLREAYERKRESYGEHDPSTLTTLDDLAAAFVRAHDDSNAMRFLELAIAPKRTNGATNLTTFLTNLGQVCARLASARLAEGRFADAESLARRAVELFEETTPDRSTLFASQGLLGAAWLGQSQYTAAEPLLRQAYERLRLRGDPQPSTELERFIQETGQRLLKLYEQSGQAEKAAEWRRKLSESGPALRP